MEIRSIPEMTTLEDVLAVRQVRSIPVREYKRNKRMDPEKAARICGRVLLYRLTYRSGTHIVTGYIAAPPDYQTHAYPRLLFNRGGNREFGDVVALPVANWASLGFVAFGSCYRGNNGGYLETEAKAAAARTGRGKDVEDFGGTDIEEVIRLEQLTQALDFVRLGKAYIMGHSRGGLETYRLLAAYPETFEAAVVSSGVADCFDMYYTRENSMKKVLIELLGGTPEQVPAEYALRSAVQFAYKIHTPVLIQHGLQDWRVSLSQAVRLHEMLDRFGTENELLLYEHAGHPLNDCPRRADVREWFSRHGYADIPPLPEEPDAGITLNTGIRGTRVVPDEKR